MSFFFAAAKVSSFCVAHRMVSTYRCLVCAVHEHIRIARRRRNAIAAKETIAFNIGEERINKCALLKFSVTYTNTRARVRDAHPPNKDELEKKKDESMETEKTNCILFSIIFNFGLFFDLTMRIICAFVLFLSLMVEYHELISRTWQSAIVKLRGKRRIIK